VRIVVIGGGVAGLAGAMRLREVSGDAEIIVLESSTRLGGKLRTVPFAGHPLETGAETILTTEEGHESAAVALARRVGLGDELVHPAGAPALYVDGRLRPMPPRLCSIPADPSTLDGFDIDAVDGDQGRPLLGR
jgi:oxygen-dependent protoporphyrinogen oxidase